MPLLAGSRFLSRELAAHPRMLGLLAATPWLEGAKPRRILERRLRVRLSGVAAGDEAGLHHALRRFKQEEMLRIAARDLGDRAPILEIADELSLLASVTIEGALQRIAVELEERYGAAAGGAGRPALGLAVLAMGKLGAGELNFSSDVDLILIYRQDGESAGGSGGVISNHRLYTKLGERLIQALSRPTADGFAFRVDLDLRPEGRAGPIALSAESAYRYYEAKGRTWERAALLKARPVAGDREVADELLASLEPFIYRRYLDLDAVEEIRAMKARIDREASRGEGDLKLGPGGIREAEFVVSALLLLHAGKNPRLRERRFLPALDRLLFAGLLSARDRDALAEAYLFLRRAEHRIQMVHERQTHQLPTSPREQELLARRLGYPSPDPEARSSFLADLSRHRHEVELRFADLLGVSGATPRRSEPGIERALAHDRGDDERIEALRSSGFFEPAAALGELQRLARKDGTPFSRPYDPQAEALLAEAARSPNPDQALRNLGDFGMSLRSPAPWFALLEENPATARLLLELFGTSDPLSKTFVRHPELVDTLLRRDLASPRRGRATLGRDVMERIRGRDDPEDALSALRRFRQEEQLRIGLHDVSGALGLEGVMAELTAVADACLAGALEIASREQRLRYGSPGDGGSLAVLSLGKLGAAELGYQSDLDLFFVFSRPEAMTSGGTRGAVGNPEYFTRLVQRLLSHLQIPLREGILYRVDTRLRPSGSQGALVVSLPALEVYHRSESALWERQALLRTRCVAGDPALGHHTWEQVLAPALFDRSPRPEELAASIVSMRRRLDEAHRDRGAGPSPKWMAGGLVDVEFAVQYLQLLYGAAHPEVRTPATLAGIERLAAAGLLAEDDAEILASGWRFLRRLELRMQIIHDRPMDRISPSAQERRTLARRMGLPGGVAGEALMDAVGRSSRSIRRSFHRILTREAAS